MEKPLFDRAAFDYDEWYQTELGQAVDHAERILIEEMFTPPGKSVLEVGSGTGHYTAWLAKVGYDVTGVDISSEMMKKAQTKLASMDLMARWVLEDIEEFTERMDTYHGVLSITAFEFIAHPERILRRLFEHLEPGGCLVIGVIAGNSSWSELYTSVSAQNPDSVFTRAHFYTEEDIEKWNVGGKLEIRRALYFSPSTTSLKEVSIQEKEKLGNPGFLVAKWVKA